MTNQKILKLGAISREQEKLLESSSLVAHYEKNDTIFSEDDCLENSDIKIDGELKLHLPDKQGHYDAENAKLIFERYKNITPVHASDARLWIYLAHFDFGKYMKARFPLPEDKKRASYIMEHWYLNGISPNTLIRQGISRLWWGAYTTYDEMRANPYELTDELFSMLDYTRTLTTGTQGRDRNFTHAMLEFVLENNDLFELNKEAKVRFIMRKMNYAGGYNILPSLSKDEIKKLLVQYKKAIEKITD